VRQGGKGGVPLGLILGRAWGKKEPGLSLVPEVVSFFFFFFLFLFFFPKSFLIKILSQMKINQKANSTEIEHAPA